MIACFINDVIYSLDVLRDDDEMRFVCWCVGGLRRNKGEIGSSGVI